MNSARIIAIAPAGLRYSDNSSVIAWNSAFQPDLAKFNYIITLLIALIRHCSEYRQKYETAAGKHQQSPTKPNKRPSEESHF